MTEMTDRDFFCACMADVNARLDKIMVVLQAILAASTKGKANG